jgi:gamma-glutamylcyclotransferase
MLRALLKVSGHIASSWTLSWRLYRLRGIHLIGQLGANSGTSPMAHMRDSAFRDWRGRRPREWCAGRVQRYQLHFNLKAPPRGKISYANLSAGPNAEVWGVLYKITRRDLVRLEATEGVPWWLSAAPA